MESRTSKKGLRGFSLIGGAAALILLMLYMGGAFTAEKIRPGKQERPGKEESPPRKTAKASLETVTEYFESVGTVRPRTEIRVESRVTGKVIHVFVRPGDPVVKGQALLRVDGREYEARLEQAVHGLASAKSRGAQMEQAALAAKAEFTRADAAFKRTRTYLEAKAATAQDMEQAEAAYTQARARLEQAEKARVEAESDVKRAMKAKEESEIALGYTRIVATESAEVAKRLVEPGDLAAPGKPLLLLQTRGRLRLEALVPEGLIRKIRQGEPLELRIDALGRVLAGRVEEVVPSADPMTRTILVKIDLPEDRDVYPGMFGRLLIPVEERKAVLIPRKALGRIGQLEVVNAHVEGRWQKLFVKSGRMMGEKVEILSGLKGGEILGLEEDPNV
ncbi:MAG: efflux RND transporter periplasmic adaptor subunit [Deltaproteobacteria bacterium]|nr:efflux RND transporter periplasmic adaptor subunit [Deltaproteobacteria bacterium]